MLISTLFPELFEIERPFLQKAKKVDSIVTDTKSYNRNCHYNFLMTLLIISRVPKCQEDEGGRPKAEMLMVIIMSKQSHGRSTN